MCLKFYCYSFFLWNGMYFQSCRFSLYSHVRMSSLFEYRSLIHLEFILAYGMRDGSGVIFFLTLRALFGPFEFGVWLEHAGEATCRATVESGWRGPGTEVPI